MVKSKKDRVYTKAKGLRVGLIASAVLITVAFLLFLALQLFTEQDRFTLTMTLGTTAYHLDVRLLVGFLVERFPPDPSKKFFQKKKWEEPLYRFLKVKRWKGKLATFKPKNFDPTLPLKTLVRNTCVAEVVHEWSLLLSFLTLFFTVFCNDFVYFYIFLSTALLAGTIDLTSLIAQRYNRPRMVKLLERREKSNKSCEKK